VDPHVAGLLRCSVCKADAIDVAGGRSLACGQCGRVYLPDPAGFFDLIDVAGGNEPTPTTPAQKLMESELVARVYDRFWRPTFVRVMAGKGAAGAAGSFSGEFFIHKSALGMEDRRGPWLDLSCGPGLFTRAMAATAPGDSVVGLDLSRAMLEVAASRLASYANVTLVRADAQDLPFADRSFAGINNAGALHVYNDAEAVFQEVYRVLAPNGVYVGSTFAKSKGPLGSLAARVTGIRRFDPPELHAWLSRIGFAEYEEVRLGDAVLFKARKP